MPCPPPNECCGNCRYSSVPEYPPVITKMGHLVACSLGRDVLRTRASWEGIYKTPVWAEM